MDWLGWAIRYRLVTQCGAFDVRDRCGSNNGFGSAGGILADQSPFALGASASGGDRHRQDFPEAAAEVAAPAPCTWFDECPGRPATKLLNVISILLTYTHTPVLNSNLVLVRMAE
jgi:hypothetical protein